MDERKQCKRDVNSHLKRKRAEQVRKQIQRRDNLIQENHPHRFRSSHQVKSVCSKLLDSEGKIITDTNDLLECWVDHFHLLGNSQSASNAFRNAPWGRNAPAPNLIQEHLWQLGRLFSVCYPTPSLCLSVAGHIRGQR